MSKHHVSRALQALPPPPQQAQGDAYPMFISLERACERYDFPNTRSFVRYARRWGYVRSPGLRA